MATYPTSTLCSDRISPYGARMEVVAGFELFASTDEAVFAGRGHVLLAWWRRSVSLFSIGELRRSALFFRRNTHPMDLLSVAEPPVAPPDFRTRVELCHLLRELGEDLRSHAFVHEGQGFAPAVTRVLVMGAQVWCGNTFAQTVCPTVEQAEVWLARQASGSTQPPVKGLAQQVALLRLAVQPQVGADRHVANSSPQSS